MRALLAAAASALLLGTERFRHDDSWFVSRIDNVDPPMVATLGGARKRNGVTADLPLLARVDLVPLRCKAE